MLETGEKFCSNIQKKFTLTRTYCSVTASTHGTGTFSEIRNMPLKASSAVRKPVQFAAYARYHADYNSDAFRFQVVMKSNACPFIVQFYGAVFKEGDCWICMELMDASLEQFYKFVYRNLNERIGEDVIGQIALAVCSPTVNVLRW